MPTQGTALTYLEGVVVTTVVVLADLRTSDLVETYSHKIFSLLP